MQLSLFLSSSRNSGIVLIMVAIMLVFSCKKEELIIKPTTIQFASTSLVINQNSAMPLTAKIKLSLSAAIQTEATVVIAIDDSSTAASTDYTTDPVPISRTITLKLVQGDTIASFTVTPTQSVVGNKSIRFKIVSAMGGVILGNNALSTIITIRKNTSLSAKILTSITSLNNFGLVDSGALSVSKSYAVGGQYLYSDISLKASDNFQISLDNTTFRDSLTIDFNVANTGQVNVFVRFVPSTGVNQNLTGTITHSSPGATQTVVTVSGTESGNIIGNILFTDNFDYGSTAGNLTAISSWQNYSGTAFPIQYFASGLSFPGYGNSAIGGAVTIENGSGSREDVQRSFPSQSSGAVYAAQLIKVASAAVNTSNTGGDFAISLRDSLANYFNRIYVKGNSTGKMLLGVARTISGGGTQIYSPTPYDFNTTYLVVTKYDFSTKETSMFIITGAIPPVEPNTADVVANTGDEPASCSNIVLRQSTVGLKMDIDGIRIANTWKNVVGL